MKFSSLKSVPDPSYALPRRRRRRRRIPRLGTRTGSTLLFSATTRFCDMKQERKYSFLTSRSIAKTRCTIRSSGVLLQTGRVFLMTFMVVVKSYMEVSNETSETSDNATIACYPILTAVKNFPKRCSFPTEHHSTSQHPNCQSVRSTFSLVPHRWNHPYQS